MESCWLRWRELSPFQDFKEKIAFGSKVVAPQQSPGEGEGWRNPRRNNDAPSRMRCCGGRWTIPRRRHLAILLHKELRRTTKPVGGWRRRRRQQHVVKIGIPPRPDEQRRKTPSPPSLREKETPGSGGCQALGPDTTQSRVGRREERLRSMWTPPNHLKTNARRVRKRRFLKKRANIAKGYYCASRLKWYISRASDWVLVPADGEHHVIVELIQHYGKTSDSVFLVYKHKTFSSLVQSSTQEHHYD